MKKSKLDLKETLYNYIDSITIKKLKSLHTILLSDIKNHNTIYTKAFKAKLDKRYKQYKLGQSKTLTIIQSKKSIQKIISSKINTKKINTELLDNIMIAKSAQSKYEKYINEYKNYSKTMALKLIQSIHETLQRIDKKPHHFKTEYKPYYHAATLKYPFCIIYSVESTGIIVVLAIKKEI
jgi:ParE toxin of type II toxin-antitoxin system, parDE